MAALDPGAGPVALLVQRCESGVEVQRIDDAAWHFMAALCAGQPLQAAIDSTSDIDASTSLAEYLAFGRFAAFAFADQNNASRRQGSHA